MDTTKRTIARTCSILALTLLFSGTAQAEVPVLQQDIFIRPTDDGRFCLYSASGECLSKSYDAIQPFWNNASIVSSDGLFGLINTEGEEILPCVYSSVQSSDNCYVVGQDTADDILYGLCDSTGAFLILPGYSGLEYQDGMAIVYQTGPGGGEGMVDWKGNVIIPLEFEAVGPLQSGWSLVWEKGGRRCNFINPQGEYLLSEFVDQCDGFWGDYALFREQDHYCIINADRSICRQLTERPVSLGINGVFLIENEDDSFIYYPFDDRYVSLNGLTADPAGFCDGLLPVQNAIGNWGFMNEALQLIIPCTYDDVQWFHEERAWAVQGDRYELIDTKGNILFSEELETASPVYDGLAAIQKDGKWGFIDQNGNLRLPPCLDSEMDSLWFVDGYCDLLWKDPYAAKWIDKNFQIVSEYDLWDVLFQD